MTRKRSSRSILLILLMLFCGMGWTVYRAVHQSALDRDLILASGTGDPAGVHALLNQGADPNASQRNSVGTGWRHLFNLLLRRKEAGSSLCPLNQALSPGELDNGHFAILQMLLEHGANPNIKLPTGKPLPLCAFEEPLDERLLPLFLKHGADPNTVDLRGVSLLIYAVNLHREAWVQALLNHGAKPDIATPNGDTALMWAAQEWNTKATKLLLSHGADVNHKNRHGQTALTYALFNVAPEQQETTEILLAAGADVNAPDKQGCTPFLFALLEHGDAVAGMLAHGADVNRAISLSATTQRISVDTQTGNSGMTGEHYFSAIPGTTPLMFAIQAQNVDLVRNMLAKGADVNARDAKGKTVLYYAGNSPPIRILLQRAGAHL